MKSLMHLLTDESGQAMTSNASFLAGCAFVGAGLWYYAGDHVYGWINTVTSSLPPDGPNAGTTLR
ncbi:MAG: hypothetical protein JWM80_1219 [Cyanobacteria bacterium RYN_339]|nr:hypothetical protein [Cyanobacteria bacterium RYN_339]